ncbi:MAG: hypothetical protein ACPL4K_04180 [Candidatus Margulisiibacteriota bacterium]
MKYRSVSEVKAHFRSFGIKVGWLSAWRLARYPEENYNKVLELAKNSFCRRVKVGPPPQRSLNTDFPAEEIESKFTEGNVLDLRGIEVYLATRRAESIKEEIVGEKISTPDLVRKLLSILVEERDYFNRLIAKPEVTIDKLFRSLVHGLDKIKGLGFNATIFRPVLSEGLAEKWVEYYRAEKWGNGTYADPKPPQSTLLSVIKSKNQRFEVKLTDPSSFEKQGLKYDKEKISFDLENSKGSPTLLIFRLDSLRGAEAVIYIHNRVARSSPQEPSDELIPGEDQQLVAEELNLYFDSFIGAINRVLELERKKNVASKEEGFGETKEVDIQTLFDEIRRNSERLNFKEAEVRLIELPSEKLYFVRRGLVKIYKELIVSLYRDSEEYRNCSEEEIIKALSLDNEEEVSRKTFLARYLPVILGGNELIGIASGNVEDHVPEVGKVFEIPVAMIKSGAKGMGLLTFVSYQMILKEFWKKWIDLGFFKGLYRMLFEGVPVFAWTQSKRVVGAMLELDNLWLPGISKKVPPKIEKIIRYFSQKHKRPLDEDLIARNVYRGRIALRKEENFSFRRKGLGGAIERIFHPKKYRKIEKLFESLGEKDTLPVVGFFTLGVALKMGIYMKVISFYNRWFGKKVL